uniref:Uncharacterized protein n=1 Tax=Opuntia streptacantha TaxID=393608 RepID=A0A7C9DUH7_OPUST
MPFHLFSSIKISYISIALHLNLSVTLIVLNPFFSSVLFFTTIFSATASTAVFWVSPPAAAVGSGVFGVTFSSLQGPPLAMASTYPLTFSKITLLPFSQNTSFILFPTSPSSLTVILTSGSSPAFSSAMYGISTIPSVLIMVLPESSFCSASHETERESSYPGMILPLRMLTYASPSSFSRVLVRIKRLPSSPETMGRSERESVK